MSIALAQNCDWTGTWDGGPEWGNIELQQSGSTVTGTYPYEQGALRGTVSGNKLTGTWDQVRGGNPISGDFEFEMSNDCTITGRWRYTSGGSGDWRTDDPSAAKKIDKGALGHEEALGDKGVLVLDPMNPTKRNSPIGTCNIIEWSPCYWNGVKYPVLTVIRSEGRGFFCCNTGVWREES